MWNKIKPYILPYSVAIAIPITVGILSAALTKDSMDIYQKLKAPPLSPPAIIFPIVWTILYVLMGISSAIIYTHRKFNEENVKTAFKYYGFSLALNFIWSLVFFRMQSSFLALLVLIALLYYIIRTILEYRKIAPIAAYLQVPYALWVIFAGYLNAGIYFLN